MSGTKRKVEDENRQYNDSWEFNYFFALVESKLTCLICKDVISVTKEYNVKRHYNTKHASTFNAYDGELRKLKLNTLKTSLKAQQDLFKKTFQSGPDIVKASYSIANILARKMKPFSDGELVKECMMAAVEEICPDKKRIFSSISISRQTVCRRINDIATEITSELMLKIKCFEAFSLAFDESTDISDTAQLAIFIRGVDKEFNITEELLNLCSLKGTTKGEDIFNAVMDSARKMDLNLGILSGLTSDAAPSMVGKEKGAISLITKEVGKQGYDNTSIFIFHCLIHQENLCAQCVILKNVMPVVIKCVNYIRSHALKHRQFQQYLFEIDSEYGDVVYFSNVRWLSRGNCLKRFYELRERIGIFLNENNVKVPELNNE